MNASERQRCQPWGEQGLGELPEESHPHRQPHARQQPGGNAQGGGGASLGDLRSGGVRGQNHQSGCFIRGDPEQIGIGEAG